MNGTLDIDAGNKRAIRAARRSYDNVDKREWKAEQRE